MTLKEWLQGKSGSTVDLRNLANAKPQTSWNDWDETINRNTFVVKAEKFAKGIAVEAGITASDTMAQMDTKLQALINDADAAGKPIAVYKANSFWTAFFVVKTVDGSGNATETISHHDPVYGQSPAEVNGWGTVTGDMIEAAQR